MPSVPSDFSRTRSNKSNEDDEDEKPSFFRRLFTKKVKKKSPTKNDEVAKQNHVLLSVFRKIFLSNKSNNKPLTEKPNKAVASSKASGKHKFKSQDRSKGLNDSTKTARKSSINVDFDKIPLDKTQSRKEKSKKRLAQAAEETTHSTMNTSSTTATSTTSDSLSTKNQKEVIAKESSKKSHKNKLKKKKNNKKEKKPDDLSSEKGSDNRHQSSIESAKSSFRSFRKKRTKELKKVTTFVSRPFRQKALSKMLIRLNKRKQKRLQEDRSQREVTLTPATGCAKKVMCDETIPAKTPPSLPVAREDETVASGYKPLVLEGNPKTENNGTNGQLAQEKLKVEEPENDDWKKKYAPVLSNNTNKGNLLMEDGRPFWHRAKKNANDEYDEDEESDDELPMNADMLNDVYEGRLVLAEMPKIPVQLDPFGSLDKLKKQTMSLCTRNIIMGNTIRTMINMCDDEDAHGNRNIAAVGSDSKPKNVPTFVDPTQLILYDRGQPKKMTRIVQLSEFRELDKE